MGNRLAAFVSRPIRDFNIENRVDKVISVGKPKVAPRHPSDAKHEPETALADASKVLEKREDLLERLKGVKVVSSGPKSQAHQSAPLESGRPLPQSRAAPQQYKYGFFEPSVVPRGRLTLRQATQLLADAKNDPNTFSPKALAAQYSLDEKDLHNVLRYFSVFRVHSRERTERDDLTSIGMMKAALLPTKQGPAAKEGSDSTDEEIAKESEQKVGTQGSRTLDTKK
ncbi:NADH dehydrogenase [ubiquinone] 1 alpha subcomplex assembly factor 4 [Dermacentor variabilis]|uniref:NADH dehydrogenase [ubiquinone] 1 alpha subcomplex assembly factor 4 n=1 Tax=Dermacentor variabilis TaxID=34621 RepID=UPI003F5C8416